MYFKFSAETEVNRIGEDIILSEILSEIHIHIKTDGEKIDSLYQLLLNFPFYILFVFVLINMSLTYHLTHTTYSYI